MIGWLAPYGLYALVLLAGPIVIHLLRTRRARRIPFPTLRFVRAVRSRAARPRLPSDPWLLLIRLAIVSAIVTAAAQPVFVLPSRVAAWDALVSRALVVAGDSDAGLSPRVAAEEANAYAARLIASDDLREGLVRAAAWLMTSPPSRKEIVVVSPVPVGGLDEASLTLLPGGTGIRFVRIEEASERHVQGSSGMLLGASGIAPRAAGWQIEGLATAATYRPADPETAPDDGLTLLGSDKAGEELMRLRRAVATAGAPAPDSAQPMVIRFRGAPPADAVDAVSERWMVETVLRLAACPELRRTHDESEAGEDAEVTGTAAAPERDRWWPVAELGEGTDGIRAAADGASLVIEVDAAPDSFAAAVVLRAALSARRGQGWGAGREVERVPAAQLAAWARPPAPVEASAWAQSESGDGRWMWLLAAMLLGVEQWLRRARAEAGEEATRAA